MSDLMKVNAAIKKMMTGKILRDRRMFPIAFLIANFFLTGSALGQTTMAHFSLDNNLTANIDNVSGTPTATQSGLTFNNLNGYVCEGTYYLYNTGSGDYIDIAINTTGFSGITISWQQRNYGGSVGKWNLTGDANNDGTYEYSKTDNANVTATCTTVSASLPSTFNNQSLVHLRLTSAVTSGTYFEIDDITISGCAPPATPIPGNNGPICAGATLTLNTPTVSGAVYLWSGPNSFTSSLQNPSITNATTAATGSYSVTVTAGGCTSGAGTTTATVNPIPVSSVSGSTNITCNSANDGTIKISATGGTGTYLFSVDDGATYKPVDLVPVNPPYVYGGLIANHAYRIKVKDGNGCISK